MKYQVGLVIKPVKALLQWLAGKELFNRQIVIVG